MQGNVIGLLATVGFATPVRFAAGSTDSKPALTSLPRGNASLSHPPPAEKRPAMLTPGSLHHLIVYIVLVALPPKRGFLFQFVTSQFKFQLWALNARLALFVFFLIHTSLW